MTEYKVDDKIISELSGEGYEHSLYLQQARREYEINSFNMTFLPIAPLAKNANMFCYDLTRETYSTSEKSYLEADKYILKKTLETTFEQGNMDFNSRLITQMGSYGGKQQPRNAAVYKEIVGYAISLQQQKNPDWVNQLSTAAKLTYLNILSDRNNVNPLSGIDFDVPQERREKSLAAEIAGEILQKDINRMTNSYNRYEKSLFSWDMQAKLLKVSLHGNTDSNTVTAAFKNLLNTIETDNRSGSSRSERVETLAELMSEMGKTNRSLHLTEDWADKVPACSEAEKLFYNGIYQAKLSDKGVFRGSVNEAAFNNAKQQVSAQKLLDRMIKHPRENISYSEIDLLAQHRPEALLAYKGFASQTQMMLLKQPNLKIEDKKRLSMMTQIINEKKGVEPWKEDALKNEDVNYFLDSAAKLKTVSPEMNKFIQAITPIVHKSTEQYKEDVAYVKESDIQYKVLLDAKKEAETTNAAGQDFYNLARAVNDIKKSLSDKDDYLKPENLEIIARNVIAGKEPNKIEFQKSGKISSLFNSKEEKKRQADLEVAVSKFNAVLPSLPRHKQVFDTIAEPLNEETYRGSYQEKARAVQANRDSAQERYDHLGEANWRRNRMFAYEKDNQGEKLEKLAQDFETRRAALKTKAQENLAFVFKGQDFTGEPVLAEHERQTKKIYKSKAEQLRGKIKDAAREEMESRGVFEKPDIEEPNKTGTKMTKESSSKVTKLMKDKKIYEKLAKD